MIRLKDECDSGVGFKTLAGARTVPIIDMLRSQLGKCTPRRRLHFIFASQRLGGGHAMLLARRLPGRSLVAQQIMPSMSVKVLKPSRSGDSFLALF